MEEADLCQILSDAISKAIAELPSRDYITDLVSNLETKINEMMQSEIHKVLMPINNKIEILERKIDVYEAHFTGIEQRLANAELRLDDTEEYSRRACLHIHGIALPDSRKENEEECLSKVKEVFKEIGVHVPDNGVDRAHRIGKKAVQNGKLSRTMIVKFVSWQLRDRS